MCELILGPWSFVLDFPKPTYDWMTVYPIQWQGVNSGITPDFCSSEIAVCRLHELMRARVRTITSSRIFYVSFQSRDVVCLSNQCKELTLRLWRQGIYSQLANAWDSLILRKNPSCNPGLI